MFEILAFLKCIANVEISKYGSTTVSVKRRWWGMVCTRPPNEQEPSPTCPTEKYPMRGRPATRHNIILWEEYECIHYSIRQEQKEEWKNRLEKILPYVPEGAMMMK